MKTISASIKRPNDNLAYSVGDVVGEAFGNYDQELPKKNILHFQTTTPNAMNIVGGRVISNAAQATPPQFDLWLFRSQVPTQQQDNTKFACTDNELVRGLLGIITLDRSFSAGSATVIQANMSNNLPMAAAMSGILVFKNNYKPIPGEEFTVQIDLE